MKQTVTNFLIVINPKNRCQAILKCTCYIKILFSLNEIIDFHLLRKAVHFSNEKK